MITLANVLATFVAGLASFVAPCTVPLLPAYLATVSGVSAADLAGGQRRGSFRGRLVAGGLERGHNLELGHGQDLRGWAGEPATAVAWQTTGRLRSQDCKVSSLLVH